MSLPENELKLEALLAQVEHRPDIRILKKVSEAAETGIHIAQGAHYPSANLIGDYYFQRPGLIRNVKWDLQLSVTLPIFQGGLVESQVRQATSQYQQAEMSLELARRNARQQIESVYLLFKSQYSQYKKQKEVINLAEKSYHAEQKRL